MHLAVSLLSKEGVCGVGDRKILKDTVTKAAFVPNLKTLVGVVTWFK